MKKSLIYLILAILLFMLLVDVIYHVFFFSSMHKKTRVLTEFEKQKSIEIIQKNMGINESNIKFGRVLPLKDKDLIQVEITGNGKKKFYIIDIKEERIIKK